MASVSFKTTPAEGKTIGKIATRAAGMAKKHGVAAVSPVEWSMDITACHANGCRLKLDELLAADDANFGHDVFGIRRHLNRKTGHVEGGFFPRYAEPSDAA